MYDLEELYAAGRRTGTERKTAADAAGQERAERLNRNSGYPGRKYIVHSEWEGGSGCQQKSDL